MKRKNVPVDSREVFRDSKPEEAYKESKWSKFGIMVLVGIIFYILNNLLSLFLNGLVRFLKWYSD